MSSTDVFDPRLTRAATRAASVLREAGATVAVAEGSCGGLVSAALLSVPGASAYYLGGAVVYTPAASRAFMKGAVVAPEGMRGATEVFAAYLAASVRLKLDATWGIGEGGAAGPSGNPYGDPPGHAWVAVEGPDGRAATRHLLTGSDQRSDNMVSFAIAAIDLLAETVAGTVAS